jgi:hypothetical protein
VTDDFQNPLRGDQYTCEDHKGVLHLFYPLEHHSGIPTKHGDKECVKTHIVLLDGPNAGTMLREAVVWGSFMVPQLKGAVGGKAVLGRLGQGQNTKGNPPWVVLDPTEEDKVLARQWTAANGDPRTTEVVSPPPTTPVSVPTATASTGNGASSANPADIVKLVRNGVDITGLTPENIALIAATLP